MLWTIFVILLVLLAAWISQLLHLGGFIHILLVIAIVVLNYQSDSRSASPVKLCINETGRDCRHRSHHHRHHRFAYGGLGWTTEKKDAQLGPLEITHKEKPRNRFSADPSGICLVAELCW